MSTPDASTEYDVLVVGAGPAGATAAAECAKRGLSVCLMDSQSFPRESPHRVWLNGDVRALIEACGAEASAILAEPVRNLTFFTSDLSKGMTAHLKDTAVHIVPRARLENALIEAAHQAGATLRIPARVQGLATFEEGVRVTLDDGSEQGGRFLIGADGARSGVGRQLSLIESDECSCWCAQWDADRAIPRATVEKGMVVALSVIGTEGIGYVLPQPDHLLIGVVGDSNPKEIVEYFEAFVSDGQAAGLLPKDLRIDRPSVWPVPAGRAIEMEAHVAKRSLLVGEAGGFVTAISYEGIYPSMWSASIAAGVVVDAAQSRNPQDALGEYDVRWRTAMADYLRMPDADLEFLLPLIFGNQQIADRMAMAFLTGKNLQQGPDPSGR